MSLFSSLNIARLALGAQQAAIQTTGQNIANANTEGYARQRVEFTPTPANDLVFARVGTGVRISRIERIVDDHLETTLREARSDLGNLSERARIIQLAESVFNDLDGGGLSQAMASFFNAVEDLANQPQDASTRALLIEEGETLAETFNFLDNGIRNLRIGLNEDIVGAVDEVNLLLRQVADLNSEIVQSEGGGTQPDTANDLRTRRDTLLGTLSEYVDIRTIENDRGSVQVLLGSQVLVLGSDAETLQLLPRSDGDVSFNAIRLEGTGEWFHAEGGRLGAMIDGRDRLALEMRSDLDQVASGFLQEFNQLHANGEGLARLTEVRTSHPMDRAQPLVALAGVETGTFNMQIVNEGDGTRETYTYTITETTTLNDIMADMQLQLGPEHPELSMSMSSDGYFAIDSSDDSLRFTFRDDNTGFLTAAGIHTFFHGSDARSIGISEALRGNVDLISTGLDGFAGDNSVALSMLELRDAQIVGTDGRTIEQYYEFTIGKIGIEGAEARQLLTNQESITAALQNQRESLSGVSIDEEAIALVEYQRAFQGAARFLNIVDRLLDTLINAT